MEQMEIGGGNTNLPQKRVTQGKRWCFTFNNYSIVQMEQMEHVFKNMDEVEGYVFQEEVGDGSAGDTAAGTPHLQGYFEFKDKGRWSQLKLPKQIHWEKAKGSRAQNIAYCSKERTWIGSEKKFSRNFKPRRAFKVLQESQLYDWQKGIIANIQEEPDDRTLNWFWSREGNVGKTTFCKYLTHIHGAIALGGKAADCRNGVAMHVELHGECPELVVIPIPKSFDPTYVSYEAMENVKDMYFYSGKYKGGMICGNCPHVYVFSNFQPDLAKMSEDRWSVHEIW